MTETLDLTFAERLRERCGDHVHGPGSPEYDQRRQAWNLAVEQRPAAVSRPSTVEEVAHLVREAAALGLRVAVQSTGHAAAALVAQDLSSTVLLRTDLFDGVFVDPDLRIVRVEGGALWRDVVAAAAPYGLVALHGSSAGVGVAGYSLGGGMGWYARKHGLAANSITAVEIVTADGEVVRADERQNSDLLWACRGGGGNFGVVTALELRLYPEETITAGMLLWDLSRADEVVRTWARWCPEAPVEVTTALRVLRFPPLPELPPFLSGRALVVVDGAVLAEPERAAAILAPLRALAPEMDTFAVSDPVSVTEIHMDPVDPTPSVGAGTVLASLDDAAVDAFLAAVGPESSTGLFMAELRQLGGALGRPAALDGAVAGIGGSHVGFFLQIAPSPEAAAAGAEETAAIADALAAWANGGSFLNLAERPVDPRAAYSEAAWERLQQVRREVDPAGMFQANHAVPVGDGSPSAG